MVTEKEQGGRLNVGPVLSPDGDRLAFLSERDLFSVELFLQDTRTRQRHASGCRAPSSIPTWRACSSSTPRARGTAPGSASPWAAW